MRAVVQRASSARVRVDGRVVGQLRSYGLVVLVGITHTDTEVDAQQLATKIWQLRILPDDASAQEINAPLLVISQFTLYADTRKGNRPSWSKAAGRAVAEPLYDAFVAALRAHGATVDTGEFGAMMDVELTNSGPVTVILDQPIVRLP